MATDTYIPKFAYRYFCWYFTKVFWLKLVWLLTVPIPTYGSIISEVDNLTNQKVQNKTWKLLVKSIGKTWKKFVEQVSIKFGDFYLIKMILVQTVLWQTHNEISVKICTLVDIQKVERISVNRYIGQSLVQMIVMSYHFDFLREPKNPTLGVAGNSKFIMAVKFLSQFFASSIEYRL